MAEHSRAGCGRVPFVVRMLSGSNCTQVFELYFVLVLLMLKKACVSFLAVFHSECKEHFAFWGALHGW